MLIEFNMNEYKLRPIIEVRLLVNGKRKVVDALVDTGADKVFWVDKEPIPGAWIKKHIGYTGESSGFGANKRTGLRVDLVDINLYGDNGLGTTFRDIPITHSVVETGGLFALVLPYTLFLGFDLGIKRGCTGKTDCFWLETFDNRINRGVKYNCKHGIFDTSLLQDEYGEVNEEDSVEELKRLGSKALDLF